MNRLPIGMKELKERKQANIEEIIRLNPYWLDNDKNRKKLNEMPFKKLEEYAEMSRWLFRDRYR